MRTVFRCTAALVPSYQYTAAATVATPRTAPFQPLLMPSPLPSPRSLQRLSIAIWEFSRLLLPSSPSLSHQLKRFRPLHTSSAKLRQGIPSSSSAVAEAAPSDATFEHFKPRQRASGADGAQQCVTEVPLVPGTFFRLAAGRSAVQIEHLGGWSDMATLQGRPAGGGSWRAVALDSGAVTPSTLASVRQVYEIRQEVDGSKRWGGAAATITGPRDGALGLLRLTIPEKWVGLDIQTSGCSVAVSKIVEADLRVATGGAAVTLGLVRGLRVDVDTSVARSGGGNRDTRICTDATGSHDGVGDSGDGCSGDDCSGTASGSGAITGGEVSGTSISIMAAGSISVRRLVGGSMHLTANLEPPAAPSLPPYNASPAAVTVAANRQGVELGAVYGGRLQISTGGGSVRIGTLDCGAARMGHRSDTSSTKPAEYTFISGSGSGSSSGSGNGSGNGSSSGSGNGSDDDTETNAFMRPSPVGGGDRDVSARSPGSGGAEILSYGGAIVLDGLEGDVLADSGGGRIKVLVQAGLRSARLVSGGGPVDVALAPGVALRLLEVRNAAEVEVQPGLQHHLERVPQMQSTGAVTVGPLNGSGESDNSMGDGDSSNTSGGNSSSGSSSSTSGVWVARVVPE
ncbi:hypothetical protein Vretifemale_15927, partial [Volvox reticuliferus]